MIYDDRSIHVIGEIPERVNYFKEESISKIFSIPKDKPCIQSICDTFICPKILNSKLVKTDMGLSNEGQKLTGNKLILELSIDIKITYIANETSQSIYALHYKILKSVFVVLPEIIDSKNVCSMFNSSRLTIVPYIEHSHTSILSKCDINTCMLLLIDVNFC